VNPCVIDPSQGIIFNALALREKNNSKNPLQSSKGHDVFQKNLVVKKSY